MVNDAAASQLVEVTPNPAHERSSLIRLTERGTTDAEVSACLRVLSQLLDNLDDGNLDDADVN